MWCGLCFAAVPTLERRFGDPTVMLVTLVLSVCVAVIVYFAWKMVSGTVTGLLAVDVLTLALLVPVVATVSGVEVSAERQGADRPYFLIAALAALGALGLVALLAVAANALHDRQVGLAVLPAVLCFAAVIGGGERFSAGALAEGLSAAWMVAAVATLIDGLIPAGARELLPFGTFAVAAGAIVALGRNASDASTISSGTLAVAYLATAAAGGALLVLPRYAAALAAYIERPAPPGSA
jgi:hypothetical protein